MFSSGGRGYDDEYGWGGNVMSSYSGVDCIYSTHIKWHLHPAYKTKQIKLKG
jgi:hypothetical protein